MDWDLYRTMIAQWRQVAGCSLGDYYPLTPYSLDEGAWIAWQFNRPEQGDGMIQAFRRKRTQADGLQAKLRGLEPDAVYTVTDLDTQTAVDKTGGELMGIGYAIAIADQPGSALIHFQKKQ